MLKSVSAAHLRGIDPIPVSVEISLSGGIPGIQIVGLPGASVLESRSRVRCALRHAGFQIPRLQLTLNLAPSELRKEGSGFDLPIALAILVATGQVSSEWTEQTLVVGELGLDGSVCPVRGQLAYGLYAQREGLCMVSSGLDARVAPVGLKQRVVTNIQDLKRRPDNVATSLESQPSKSTEQVDKLDYTDVIDQDLAKRALVVAALGRHGLIMVGPPGTGKSMLARRLPSILDELSDEERMEVILLHSLAGLSVTDFEQKRRPFRSPHHSLSAAALVGGGRPVSPGEISLAHKGILFLDELAEFSNNALQSLRQPLEEHVVRIVRIEGSFMFPCDFQLICASNPCPCGYLGDSEHPCRCAAHAIERYHHKLGGPLMDRIDMRIDVSRPASRRVLRGEEGLSSEAMHDQLCAAQEFRLWRAQRRTLAAPQDYKKEAPEAFSEQALKYLEQFSKGLGLSGRAMLKTSRVARTIADLNAHELVCPDDVAEACAYRQRTDE